MLTQGLPGRLSSNIFRVLHSIRPSFADGYAAARLSTRATRDAEFTSIVTHDGSMTKKLQDSLPGQKISRGSVYEVCNNDISKDYYGQILVSAGESDLITYYGECGKAASRTTTPTILAQKHELIIPKHSFGVLDIANKVPFFLDGKDFFALSTSQIARVLPYEESIKRFSIDTVESIDPLLAKRLSIKIQDRIYGDRGYEMFYKETTSKVVKPSHELRSSATLMNFEEKGFGEEDTTGMHYHPGERMLLIFTTERDASVKLNFCGIKEDPESRPDCDKEVKFPKNSIFILRFPEYTHHKFFGDFVCISFHPVEGYNLIEALRSGNLSGGFLESATVFSKKDSEAEKSLPSTEIRPTSNSTPKTTGKTFIQN